MQIEQGSIERVIKHLKERKDLLLLAQLKDESSSIDKLKVEIASIEATLRGLDIVDIFVLEFKEGRFIEYESPIYKSIDLAQNELRSRGYRIVEKNAGDGFPYEHYFNKKIKARILTFVQPDVEVQ